MGVINQTYKNSELIIIDDESIDKSPNIIKELINKIDLSKKIKFEIQDNMGLSKTLNKGIKSIYAPKQAEIRCKVSLPDLLIGESVESIRTWKILS